jgi:hypothetical protein
MQVGELLTVSLCIMRINSFTACTLEYAKACILDIQNFIHGTRIGFEGSLPLLCQFFTYVLESHLDNGFAPKARLAIERIP